MRLAAAHAWPSKVAEARVIQESLRHRVITEGGPPSLRRIAGVDIHVAPATGLTWAAIAVLEWPGLELCQSVLAAVPTGFPYVPGYLSFREIPAALAALALVDPAPDLLMVDGHGIAHPRRMGIAAHLGVLTDLPTIGVAKSRLCGQHEEPPTERGGRVPLTDKGQTIGIVLRSRVRSRPLYVSIGHRIALDPAVELVLATLTGYRLPEPTRVADKLSRMHP